MPQAYIRSFLLISILSLFVVGCWDRQEIEERMSATAIALDRDPSGYELTMQVPIPTQIAGGGGGGGGGGNGGGGGASAVDIFSAKGRTLIEVISSLERQSTKPIYLGNMQLMLFGEKQARQGIGSIFDMTKRNPEVRRQLWPVVVKGKAKDAIMTQTKLEQISSNYFRETLETGIKEEIVPNTYLGKVYVELSTPSRQVPIINYFTPMKDKFEWSGLAVFDRDKMIGKIEAAEDINALLHMRYEKKGGYSSVSCPKEKGVIIFQPEKITRDVKISNRPEVQVNIEIWGIVVEKKCFYNLSGNQSLSALENYLKRDYEKNANRLIDLAQKKWKVDIFHFSEFARAYHPGLWKKVHWEKSFPQIPVRVHYKVKVRGVGGKVK
ncbi:Ger(x)C family spore germination protein [Thermoflavimicrobium daqui]|uniref:Germination protein, Ger(X)C family n=1 Tax=Thermoflavimicrobium daqui TaxID=2137476 RepID=A0A364K741_9BACL|nr:Ger(x)C family spore germination protein [Thermoflavimicrobium daqui]RAL26121.1 hypothetical protein DL897_03720 [Thermoflavimicrobium daqui]